MISSYQLYHYSQRCQLNLTARQFMNYYLLYIYIYYVFIIRWGTHIYVSLFPYAHPSVCLSIHRIPYRRNHTSSNHNFWYIHVCKMIISLSFCFFFIFLKFLFFGLLGGRGKGKKPNMKKKLHLSHTISQEQWHMIMSSGTLV